MALRTLTYLCAAGICGALLALGMTTLGIAPVLFAEASSGAGAPAALFADRYLFLFAGGMGVALISGGAAFLVREQRLARREKGA